RNIGREVAAQRRSWTAAPLVNGRRLDGAQASVRSPAHPELVVGHVIEASAQQAHAAAAVAHEAQQAWGATRAEERAARLERLAGLMEEHLHELMALCVWKRARRCRTRWPTCARRWTSAATTHSRR